MHGVFESSNKTYHRCSQGGCVSFSDYVSNDIIPKWHKREKILKWHKFHATIAMKEIETNFFVNNVKKQVKLSF